MPPPVPPRLAAALSGQYRVTRELGVGGMATVYLAEDLKHEREVAVKVLDPQLAATVGADRFLREIRITAALQHPHILTLIDSGEADGFLYYVMPFVDGVSLRARLVRAGGPLPLNEALTFLRELLDALAHAHAQGLVHRDVKPENIMLAGRHAMVLDFGVAKALQTAREGARPVVRAEGTLTSIGTSLGTPSYMAPEQAAGDPDVDHRADLYSAALVAYEMLSGRVPFTGRPHEVLAAQVTATPRPLREIAPAVPAAIAELVMRTLAKRPEDRPQSAEAMLRELDAIAAPAAAKGTTGWRRIEQRLGRTTARLGAVAAVVLVGVLGAVITKPARDASWLRNEALPEIDRLAEAGHLDSALRLVAAARERLPRDTALEGRLWDVAYAREVQTEPAGVELAWRPLDGDAAWHPPVQSGDSLWLPRIPALVRARKAGFRERILFPAAFRFAALRLEADDAPHPEMDRIFGGETQVAMPGLSDIPVVEVDDYLLDRFEVTNAEYKRFVDAGGYANADYWTDPIVGPGGRTLSLRDAAALLVDRTGRPGPATWEGGSFPSGAGDLPVGGVSWFEAMAYARFAGKELPTLYHWTRAAGTPQMDLIVTRANFGADRPQRGPDSKAMSPYGTYDMAGNVREWVANSFASQRFILGGGWTDQTYAFVDAYAQAPIDRSPINGIRLMKRFANDSTSQVAWAPIARQMRDYRLERPVNDEVYRGLVGTYAYDRVPLDVRAESVDSSSADYTVERVTIATPYGRERMPIYLYTPRRAKRPLQAVVFFPGSGAFYQTTREEIATTSLDAVINSGRMVVWPIYASQYEREHTLGSDSPRETANYRDHVAMWVKDVRRTVDFLQTRADVDTARIGYFGFSFGGRMAPISLATEPRFKAAVLAVAGLKMERPRPESDPLNFLPRVRIPVLMLNGEFDHYFPLQSSQIPFFSLLGTPPTQKRHVVFKGGHSVPRTLLITEVLAWLDTYLGAVAR
jgi:eukaryotic-like serine/threonine-protein kinase